MRFVNRAVPRDDGNLNAEVMTVLRYEVRGDLPYVAESIGHHVL